MHESMVGAVTDDRRASVLPQEARVAAGGASWSLGDLPENQALACLQAALEAGVQVIDTAGAYTTASGGHHNEQLIAQYLARRYGSSSLAGAADPARQGRPVVVTKCGHHRTSATIWDIDARPQTLRRDVLGSLQALRLEALDVCLLHWPDPKVPLSESIGALADMQCEGLLNAVGVSNTNAQQLQSLLSSSPGHTPISVLQLPLSAVHTTSADVLEQLSLAHRAGVQVMGYAPFGGPGSLPRALETLLTDERAGTAVPLIVELSQEWGRSVHQLLLSWLLHVHPRVTLVVGSSQPSSISDAAASTSSGASEGLSTSQHVELSAAVAELHAHTARAHGVSSPDPDEKA